MAFNASSTLYLCGVPIDNTYQHEIYFASKNEQYEYFSNRVVKTFTNYTTIRKTLADGGMQSSVKVEANIDDLYKCNYMFYQNANHGTRYFYCFITNLIYINESVTEIVFETDVYQTWLFDVTFKESYVIREHSVTDYIGDNIIPEKFAFQDYNYTEIEPLTGSIDVSSYGYLVATSSYIDADPEYDIPSDSSGTRLHSGIYQGLFLYYFPDVPGVDSFIRTAENVEDCVQFIIVIPKFNISNNVFSNGSGSADDEGWGLLGNTKSPAKRDIVFYFALEDSERLSFYDYTPKNNKLYTAPFTNLVITNNAGSEAVYNIEDWGWGNKTNRISVQFDMCGDISANPSVTLYPKFYKNNASIDHGISISNFPQSSFVSDAYKLWLAKNQYGVGLDIASSLASIVAGVAVTAGTSGAGAGVGVGQIVGGISGIANTMNNVYTASKQPNSSQSGATKNNLLTALKKNTFTAFLRTIKPEFAKMVDDFFTMFGYQTNSLKIPNVSSRPYYNYIQTANCNLVGTIPDNDMRQLKTIYNTGITLWKPSATVGDYSVDNSPIKGE